MFQFTCCDGGTRRSHDSHDFLIIAATDTETHYKVCSLPDKTKWVTEKVNWGLESEQWDDFDPDKVKIWEGDEIGEKFEGIITCYGIDFDFRDKSQISDREKEMIDKINNNHYDFDEWVDFDMDQGADMVERDYKFLEMKLGTDETNSFFPILKFLD